MGAPAAVAKLGRLLSPHSLRGIAVEAAWVSAHAALYPLALMDSKENVAIARNSLAGLPPHQRGLLVGDVEAAGTPIILVHGVVDNHSAFTVLRRALHRKGFGSTYALDYSPLTDDIRKVATELGALVEDVSAETGYDRVHVVGHSMGGLIGRYLVQRLGGDEKVHTLVTIGTPHAGTAPARLIPLPIARQMRTDSDLINDLAGPSPGCRTRIVSIWSDLDQVVLPQANAQLHHPDLSVRNVRVRGVGHISLPMDGSVVHHVCSTLAMLDEQGHLRAG